MVCSAISKNKAQAAAFAELRDVDPAYPQDNFKTFSTAALRSFLQALKALRSYDSRTK